MTQDKHTIHIEHDTALVTDTGGIVCNQVCSREWAESITRAVNSHYQLVEALERMILICEGYNGLEAKKARQALSNAKGDIDPAA